MSHADPPPWPTCLQCANCHVPHAAPDGSIYESRYFPERMGRPASPVELADPAACYGFVRCNISRSWSRYGDADPEMLMVGLYDGPPRDPSRCPHYTIDTQRALALHTFWI